LQTRHQKLEEIARLVGAEKEPYYVRVNELPLTLRPSFPADGWYWVPPHHHVAVFLARVYDEARDQLMELLRRQAAEEPVE
jgi:hypothetical protein